MVLKNQTRQQQFAQYEDNLNNTQLSSL